MSEIKLPLTLIVTALIIYAGYGFAAAGPAGGVTTVFLLLLQALITSVLGIAACFATAQILGTHFGTIESASAKLAAVALFPGAVGALILMISPMLVPITVIALTFGLLKSLFDMELMELIVFLLIFWGVTWVAEQVMAWF